MKPKEMMGLLPRKQTLPLPKQMAVEQFHCFSDTELVSLPFYGKKENWNLDTYSCKFELKVVLSKLSFNIGTLHLKITFGLTVISFS